jgi:quinol monooxygenase YgiN
MIVLVAKYHVKPGQLETVLASLRKMKTIVDRDEPTCKFYQVSRSTEAENLLMLYEHYPDQAALAGHRETPHFKSIIEGEVVPRLDKRERELYELQIA